MNSINPPQKTLYINLDLLFDFYSVFFSAYRTYFAKHSLDINALKHCIEGKSFSEGLTNLLKESSLDLPIAVVREEIIRFVDVSLQSIKPTIGAHTILKDLAKNGVQIKVYTHFEEYVLNHVREAHKEWFTYEIISAKDVYEISEIFASIDKESIVFISSSVESASVVRKEGVCTVYVPISKKAQENLLKDEKLKESFDVLGVYNYETLEAIEWSRIGVENTIKWPEKSFYLQLNNKPVNEEYEVWKNVYKLKEPIELTSDIVHGFGRGGKKLGIPTANLDMKPEIEEKLVDLVSGVYYGLAEFMPSPQVEKSNEELELSKQLPMVMSIGFNPYFNNKYKTAEAHIMKKFDKDFYNSVLKVTILGFIRNEADFLSFSHLIEAIHNDVQVAKDILSSDLE